MDLSQNIAQTLEDIEDVTEALRYPEEDMSTEYEDDVTTEEEEEKTEMESETVINEPEVLADYMTEFEAKKAKKLAEEAEEEREKLRHLIGVQKKKDEASEETLITPEEEVIEIDEVSTEDSIHPCLREIDISDSQLKLVNPYTVYPIPNDPGLGPAFWLLHERPPIYTDEGVKKFYDMVKHFDLRPIRSLKDMFVTDEINLRYYGLESRVMRAICEALVHNTCVREVNLKDNKLSTEACRNLNDLLLKNNVITSLSLSGCQIGPIGAKRLYDAISMNATLKTLDLSNCNIGNNGFEYIASALSNNQSLESVNLSDNHLDELCSENLRDLLSFNGTLTHLDLSWNSLYSAKIWKALRAGLNKNETLLSLNLSWNSLEKECVPYLCQLLSRSQNIEKLDLSWNRFTEDNAVSIAKALPKSKLRELYLGNNPLKAEGVLALVRAITSQPSSNGGLRLLDLENVWANKDILPELKLIDNLELPLTIKLGGILSNYPLVGPNVKRILFKRANYEAMKPKRKRRRRNFGHFIMSLRDKTIPRAKFMGLVQKFKLKLSDSLVNEIMNAFEGPKNTVDQALLKSVYLEEYPETTPAPLVLQKKRKSKAI